MQPAGCAPQIVKRQDRPIFTETVGEDPVRRLRAAEVEDRLTDRVHTPDGLHGYLFPRGVSHLYLNGPVGTLVIKLEYVNQLGFAVQFGTSDRHLAAGAELIFECR